VVGWPRHPISKRCSEVAARNPYMPLGVAACYSWPPLNRQQSSSSFFFIFFFFFFAFQIYLKINNFLSFTYLYFVMIDTCRHLIDNEVAPN
jgi:hypothetical protein